MTGAASVSIGIDGSSPALIASPALKGTIVLAQCRSWLLAEEESRCRQMLNRINGDKHALKTSLMRQSENMQAQISTLTQSLIGMRNREEQLRKDLDASSTLYLRLYRDKSVSRGDDRMLREKQNSNLLWTELEPLIHQRNEADMKLARLEQCNGLIIQNLYQTHVLLQTQQAQTATAQSNASAAVAGVTSEPPKGAALDRGTAGMSGDEAQVQAAPLIDPRLVEEVARLTLLRNSEINLQKKLSKFLGLREQVQSYLLKIAGYQKKVAHSAANARQAAVAAAARKSNASAPSSGRASPNFGTSSDSPIRSASSNALPIITGGSGGSRKRSGSGSGTVFRPSPDTTIEFPDTGAAGLPASASYATSASAGRPAAPAMASSRAMMNAPRPNPNHHGAHHRSASLAHMPTSSSFGAPFHDQQHVPSTSTAAAAAAASFAHERERIEKSQLAQLVFDQRNRKVLSRVCENFQRSGLPSARRWKRSPVLIQNAFLGVELLTWVLNIGLAAHRSDALILLELLLRAGLVDMIQGEGEKHQQQQLQKGNEDETGSTSMNPSDFGDLKLQFALYRLRGDANDLSQTQLSKSGWLHKVSRWRMQRRYFAWDADEHRLSLFESNKDERPKYIYHLGACTVIQAVDDATSINTPRSSGNFTLSSSPATTIPSALNDSKFYFQLHLHPPQHDENMLMLCAPSQTERSEWLKVLWLSGCDYPAQSAATVGALMGPSAAAGLIDGGGKLLAPGSRPVPVRPAVPSGGSDESGSEGDDEEDDIVYEDSAPPPTAATDTFALGEEPNFPDPTRPSLARSASVPVIGGGPPLLRRPVSLADKKHESDLMGVFALRRAKAKFALQAAWNRVQEQRQMNQTARTNMRQKKQHRSHSSADGSDSTLAQQLSTTSVSENDECVHVPACDGLELNWRELFVPGYDSGEEEPHVSTHTNPAAVTASQTPASVSPTPRTIPIASSVVENSVTPDSVPLSSSAESDDDNTFKAEASGSASDDELGQQSDYNSENELDEAGEIDEEGENSSSTDSNDPEQQRMRLRKQRFQAVTASLNAALELPDTLRAESSASAVNNNVGQLRAGVLAAQAAAAEASSNASNSNSTGTGPTSSSLPPLTAFVVAFVNQYRDLYLSALALDLAGGVTQTQGTGHRLRGGSSSLSQQQSSSNSAGVGAAWPALVQRSSVLPHGITSPIPNGGESSANSTPVPSSEICASVPSFPDPASVTLPPTREIADSSVPDQVITAINSTAIDADVPPVKGAADLQCPPPAPDSSDAPVAVPLYPFPRHASAVLSAAKEDAHLLQTQLGQLIADVLSGCEAALKKQAEKEARASEVALQGSGAATADKRSTARAVANRAAPVLRRIERDISLLQRLCTQLLCHRVLSLLYDSLFPLYCCVSARKNAALQLQLYRHRHLTFRQMGLAEELIFASGTNDSHHTKASHDTSYDHASQFNY
jgi:hypothetical protein